jgi:hypothetical protein
MFAAFQCNSENRQAEFYGCFSELENAKHNLVQACKYKAKGTLVVESIPNDDGIFELYDDEGLAGILVPIVIDEEVVVSLFSKIYEGTLD